MADVENRTLVGVHREEIGKLGSEMSSLRALIDHVRLDTCARASAASTRFSPTIASSATSTRSGSPRWRSALPRQPAGQPSRRG